MATKIIGRKAELKVLSDMLGSKSAEFMVLYGRRRIGKSFLIENFFSEKNCYFFHVTGIKNGILTEQIKVFSQAIGNTFYNGAPIQAPTSWLDAFELLTRAINESDPKKKVVLFIDELPWLCTKRSRLIQSIDFYWNRFWKNNPRIKLIVCGSSASWIIRKIIHHKGGLHNRNTRSMLLKPFNLYEVRAFLNASNIKLNIEQITHIYMFCGGVPYYLNYIQKGQSTAQMIDVMCFQENGVLYNEFDKLFESLFNDATVYKNLIRIIASSREGIERSVIEAKSHATSKGGTLTDRLKDLEDASFIKSFTPLNRKKRGTYYRITDEYSYFYLKWIEPAKNTLSMEEDHNQYWSSKLSSAAYHAWRGYAFESICYKHLGQIRRALNIHTGATIGVWRHKPKKGSTEPGAQIDLVFDRDDGATTLCEIKYTDKSFVIDKNYSDTLMQKIQVYAKQTKTPNQLFLALISAKGVKTNGYSDQLVDALVTLDDLFKDRLY